MSNVATITPTPSMPSRVDPTMQRTLDVMLSGATTQGATLVLLPSKEIDASERHAMQARLSTLRRSLDHRDRAAAKATLAAFLASYGSVRGNEDEAEFTIAAYLAVLSDTPPWAIAEGAKAWTRGGYGAVASAFAPSAAQFHEVTANIVRPFANEATSIEAVLSARITPISADERARVEAGFDALASDLGKRQTEAQKQASAAQRFAAMCEEAGVDPDSVPNAPVTAGRPLSMPKDGTEILAWGPEANTP